MAHRMGQVFTQSCVLSALLLLLLGTNAATDHFRETKCTRQELIRARPQQLGVHSFKMLGELTNFYKGADETVVLHAYVKMVIGTHTTRLRGYGWLECMKEHIGSGYAPQHWGFMEGDLPAMHIHTLGMQAGSTSESLMEWDNGTEITITQGKGPDRNMLFRLDAVLDTTQATLFQIRIDGWPRTVQLSLEDFKEWPGLITPWHNMELWEANDNQTYNPMTGYDLPNRRLLRAPRSQSGQGSKRPSKADKSSHSDMRWEQLQATTISRSGNPSRRLQAGTGVSGYSLPPPSQSPLFAVVFLGYTPTSETQQIFTAQKLLRHVEYHLLQAGMQRVLVYARENVFSQQLVRDYIAWHLPAAVQPYITFVVWNEVPLVDVDPSLFRGHVYWDQHIVYNHAAVALADHPSAFAAFIDVDEYIAWPRPAWSLHEALSLCKTDELVSIGLTSMYTLCHDCDYLTNPFVEHDWWTAVQHSNSTEIEAALAALYAPNGNSTPDDASTSCKWYSHDPLKRYNWTWDDTYLIHRGSDWEKGRTSDSIWFHRGKQLLRVEDAKVFTHHRSGGLEEQKQRWLDPEFCPFIAHFYNLDGYRGEEDKGALQWFAKHWSSNWWLLPPPVNRCHNKPWYSYWWSWVDEWV